MDNLTMLLLDKVNTGIIVIDEKQIIINWNQWIENYSGITTREALNKQIATVIPLFEKSYYQQLLNNAINNSQSMFCSGAIHSVFVPRKNNNEASDKVFKQNMVIEPVAYEQKAYVLIQINDITNQYKQLQILKEEIKERKRIEEILIQSEQEMKLLRDCAIHASMVDGLTGIPNRRRFDEEFSLEWRRALRYQSNISIIMIDIDFFKNYNDTYGHLDGDESLRKVANTLQNCLKRPMDTVARWGGEEFVCLLPETDSEGAFQMAEEIRKRIEETKIPHESSLVAAVLTVSLGVATMVPTQEKDQNALVKLADQALYKAKASGRNQVAHYLEG